MRIEGINVVFFWVSDVDAATSWFSEVLGLEQGPRHGDWQEFQVPGATRFAIHGGRPAGADASAVVAFTVSDLDAAVADLARRGVSPLDEETNTGAARFVTYADPDGNHVQLIQPRS